MKVFCFSCAKIMDVIEPVGRRQECPHCGSDVRCCLNCDFYDERVAQECREPMAELVKQKDRSNYCDYFKPSLKVSSEAQGTTHKDLLKQAEALFKKK